MTPRERIFALSYDLPMQRLVKEIAARGFSRVPIYQKSLDNIRGIVNAKDLVRDGRRPAARSAARRAAPRAAVRAAHDAGQAPVPDLQAEEGPHGDRRVSEYGKVLGLVTMDDLLVADLRRAARRARRAPAVDPAGQPARADAGAGRARVADARRSSRAGSRRFGSRRRARQWSASAPGTTRCRSRAKSRRGRAPTCNRHPRSATAARTGASAGRGHAAGRRYRATLVARREGLVISHVDARADR